MIFLSVPQPSVSNLSSRKTPLRPSPSCLASPASPEQWQTPGGPPETCRGSCWGAVWLRVCWRMSDCKVCTGTRSLCRPPAWSRLTGGCRMSFCLWSPLRQPAAPVGAPLTAWTGPSNWSPGETPGGWCRRRESWTGRHNHRTGTRAGTSPCSWETWCPQFFSAGTWR